MIELIWMVWALCSAMLFTHLCWYPWLMAGRAGRYQAVPTKTNGQSPVAILVPCFNEARQLDAKLNNLLQLQGARHRLTVRVVIDGGSDNSAAVARGYRQAFRQAGIRLQICAHQRNRGKRTRLDQHLPRLGAGRQWLLLSDCSALLSSDALMILDGYFQQPDVGAVTGHYWHQRDGRLQAHWRRLNQTRCGEDRTGLVMGGAGAALALRPQLIQPLPRNCINDDFELVMAVLRQGFQSRFAEQLQAMDIAPAASEQLYAQRRRIAAGNVMQLPGLWRTIARLPLAERLIALAGKGLRGLLPLLMCGWLASTIGLMGLLPMGAWWQLAALMLLALLIGAPHLGVTGRWSAVSLAVQGAVVGALMGLFGGKVRWHRTPKENSFQPQPVRMAKRSLDIVAATTGLLLTMPLLPLIALAIKLDSPGTVLYRQLRIGARHSDRTELIYITKFRTMGNDAERGGARWASPQDPRVTRVGRILRTTRLDELPQLWQVLTGQLSLVGPRPERPQFCGELEQKLPFYLERTFGLRPGLTGLAQVHQSGDTCLQDVQNKLQYDHAYAASLAAMSSYWRMELAILWRTVWVVAAAKGH